MDVAKGIAIILMVIGHTSIPKAASDFIFAFHRIGGL
jgi:fucose 4-O-acetylase-like acetyltransferase